MRPSSSHSAAALLLVLLCAATLSRASDISGVMAPYRALVFQDSAEVWFSSSFTLPAGVHTLRLHNLTSTTTRNRTVEEGSIRFLPTPGLTVQQLAFQTQRVSDEDDAEVLNATAELETASSEVNDLLAQRGLVKERFERLESVLQAARSLDSRVNVNATLMEIVENLEKAAAVRTRVGEELSRVQAALSSAERRVLRLKTFLQRAAASAHVVRVVVRVEREGTYAINASRLVTSEVSWQPFYDVAAKTREAGTAEGTVAVSYYAVVTQNTGVDWTDVELELCTRQPSYDRVVPRLGLWTIGHVRPPTFRGAPSMTRAPIQNMDQNQNTQQVYGITVIVGSKEQSDDAGAPPAPAAPAAEAGAEVVGGEADFSVFKVPHRHTLASGVRHRVKVADVEVPCAFERVVVPRRSDRVHLRARLNNTSPLTFVRGPATISVEGSYAGTMTMPLVPRGAMERLELGVDRSMEVRRMVSTKQTKDQGMFRRREHGQSARVTIKIVSHRDDAVLVRVLEQMPVSKNDQVGVRLISPAPVAGPTLLAADAAVVFPAAANVTMVPAEGTIAWRRWVPRHTTEEIVLAFDVMWTDEVDGGVDLAEL
jgi:uncharacterized protein (TIGR02231 family)